LGSGALVDPAVVPPAGCIGPPTLGVQLAPVQDEAPGLLFSSSPLQPAADQPNAPSTSAPAHHAFHPCFMVHHPIPAPNSGYLAQPGCSPFRKLRGGNRERLLWLGEPEWSTREVERGSAAGDGSDGCARTSSPDGQRARGGVVGRVAGRAARGLRRVRRRA